MSARHPWDSTPPPTLTREGRIQLLHQAATDLLAGRMPSAEAAAFLAGGLLSWLECGNGRGSLERDFWKLSGIPGSRYTPQRLYHCWQARQDPEEIANVSTSNTDEE